MMSDNKIVWWQPSSGGSAFLWVSGRFWFVLRGIVKEMGLTGKITPDQVAKKWDNLKTKFKVPTFISSQALLIIKVADEDEMLNG